MKETSLCYLFRDGKVLLLHRTKKENDLNENLWIGIGGKFEENESPEDCVLREFQEETGLTPIRPRYRGVVTFVSDRWEGEHMHLFTADEYRGVLNETCDEGVLEWVDVTRFRSLPTWEGDRIFLDLLDRGDPFFSLKLVYHGKTLTQAVLNGTVLSENRL